MARDFRRLGRAHVGKRGRSGNYRILGISGFEALKAPLGRMSHVSSDRVTGRRGEERMVGASGFARPELAEGTTGLMVPNQVR